MQLDLVYFGGCPHVPTARAHLKEALASLGLTATWREWDTNAGDTPGHLRGYPSPTILIDGIDVEGGEPQEGATCAAGGAPTVETLLRALVEPSG
jgi:mercuric ion transport protein